MKKLFMYGCAGCGCLIIILIILLAIGAFFFLVRTEVKPNPSSTTWISNQNVSSI